MRPLWLLISLTLAGCSDPYDETLTTVRPTPKDVVGLYVVDHFHLPTEMGDQKADIALELRADGTFTGRNLPRFDVLPVATLFQSLVSGDGQWTISEVAGGRPYYGIAFRNVTLERQPRDRTLPANNLMFAHLTGKKIPHGLLFKLPDGYAVVLKKKQ